MKWRSNKYKSFDELHPPQTPWKWWFAWYPVTTNRTTYWLCWIPRRMIRTGTAWVSYYPEYIDPQHSIGGNILGEKGYKHGPNKKLKR